MTSICSVADTTQHNVLATVGHLSPPDQMYISSYSRCAFVSLVSLRPFQINRAAVAYSTPFLQGKSPKVSNIFSPSLTVYGYLFVLFASYAVPYSAFTLVILYYYAKSFLKSRDRSARLFLWTNKFSPRLFWTVYFIIADWQLFDTTLTTFGDDFTQAWRDYFERKGGTLDLQIFVGKDSFSVPILCKIENGVCTVGSDAKTFRSLRMWYAWMQYRRWFGERVIPRKLTRVDQVEVRTSYSLSQI
jgi:hypothetical protein